jgi:hypothetical protein
VVRVRVMEVAADAVIDVIAVRNRLMAAAGSLNMACLMPSTAMVGGAVVRVVAGDFDHMLVDMALMRVMEVTIVQIIGVAAVTNGRMAAAGAMLVRMVGVIWCGAGGHRLSSFLCPGSGNTAVRPSAAWSIALRINGSTCSSASA